MLLIECIHQCIIYQKIVYFQIQWLSGVKYGTNGDNNDATKVSTGRLRLPFVDVYFDLADLQLSLGEDAPPVAIIYNPTIFALQIYPTVE